MAVRIAGEVEMLQRGTYVSFRSIAIVIACSSADHSYLAGPEAPAWEGQVLTLRIPRAAGQTRISPSARVAGK